MMNEELAHLKHVFMKNPPTPQQVAPYYSPREYGNREYSGPATTSRTKGCCWDGQMHLKITQIF